MDAVYFIYPLDSDHDRWFWAVWLHEKDFVAQYAPRDYGMSGEPVRSLLDKVLMNYPSAQALMLSKTSYQGIYRRVRRSELPWDVQTKIRETLAQRKQERDGRFESLGFLPEHRESPETVKQRFRQLARRYHPDNGGSAEGFMCLKQVYGELMRRFL